jgi:hypothetical protein
MSAISCLLPSLADESVVLLGLPCSNLVKSMRRPCAEREGTHGPRLENAHCVRVTGGLCPLSMQRERNLPMSERSQKSAVQG